MNVLTINPLRIAILSIFMGLFYSTTVFATPGRVWGEQVGRFSACVEQNGLMTCIASDSGVGRLVGLIIFGLLWLLGFAAEQKRRDLLERDLLEKEIDAGYVKGPLNKELVSEHNDVAHLMPTIGCSPFEAIRNGVARTFQIRGRASQSEFWWYVLFLSLLCIVLDNLDSNSKCNFL